MALPDKMDARGVECRQHRMAGIFTIPHMSIPREGGAELAKGDSQGDSLGIPGGLARFLGDSP